MQPIVTCTWILLNDRYGDPAKAAAVKEFLSWGPRDGQAIAPELGYISLPQSMIAKASEALDHIKRARLLEDAEARTFMESKDAVGVLAALAQDTRLAIFRHLVTAGDDGVPAGSIAASLEVPGPTLSFHLKELERAGIVTSRRESRLIYYSANYAGMRALIDFLTEDCCNGRPEVCFPSKRLRVARAPGASAGCRPASKPRKSRS